MIIGDVTGEMISTERYPELRNQKLLVVQPLDPEGRPEGRTVYAIDTVSAGVGDRVLLNNEGHAAIELLGLENPPIRTLIVAVIDTVVMNDHVVYEKRNS